MNNAQRPPQGEKPTIDLRPGGGRRGPAMVAEKPKNLRKTVKRLLTYIGKKRNLLIIMVLCVILSAGVTLTAPILQTEALNFLTIESAGGFIRREVGSRILIRYTPQLHFVMDDSIEYGVRMTHRIEEVLGDSENENE